jgi:hypothetical protein
MWVNVRPGAAVRHTTHPLRNGLVATLGWMRKTTDAAPGSPPIDMRVRRRVQRDPRIRRTLHASVVTSVTSSSLTRGLMRRERDLIRVLDRTRTE